MPGATPGAGMTDTITVTYTYDRALWRRAMTGWWRSVIPPRPFLHRAIAWAVIWMAIAVLAGAISHFGLSPAYVVAGLLGAACLVGVFTFLQRTRMARFWDIVGSHWDTAGATEAQFRPDGLVLTDTVSRHELAWSAIDAVAAVRGGTVLRSGISMTVIPDSALPEEWRGKDFRAQLADWRQP